MIGPFDVVLINIATVINTGDVITIAIDENIISKLLFMNLYIKLSKGTCLISIIGNPSISSIYGFDGIYYM